MLVKAQDGKIHDINCVVMQNGVIYGECGMEKALLGSYPTLKRACEVLAEITYTKESYEMPEE